MKREAEKKSNDAEQQQEGTQIVQQPATLEVKKGRKRVRLEFASEADRDGWQKAYRKTRWYTFYFLVGVGVNFLMYFAGLDLSRQIFWGALVGIGVPLSSMFLLTELHFYLLDRRTKKTRS